jgi:hypothetical protein
MYSPLLIVVRVVVYSLLVFGIGEGIFFDAGHPLAGSYFGEITFTEISQEIIFFVLFLFYLFFGYKWRTIQPVSNIIAFFFLLSFIREFNFLEFSWIYPSLLVLGIIAWLVVRDFKRIKQAAIEFFSVPASAWLISGFLATYIFSRLMGRSKFWKLMYDEETYRLAKAATEEGIELFGDTILLISAVEFLLYYWFEQKKRKE